MRKHWVCSVPGCDRPHLARGFCKPHYRRFKLYGDPLGCKPPGVPRRPLADRFWEKVGDGPFLRPDLGPCREWKAGRNRQGYGSFEHWLSDKWMSVPAHRVAWELAYGPIPDGLVVCHHCDNPPCCQPMHLFLGTVAINNADRDAKGRNRLVQPTHEQRARGERTGAAKLTELAVREIRQRYAAGGVSQQSLADEYRLGQSQVSRVIRRTTWAHVVD